MKKIFNKIAALAIAGTVLFGCQADKVAPQEGRVGGPSIAGAAGDPHPASIPFAKRLTPFGWFERTMEARSSTNATGQVACL